MADTVLTADIIAREAVMQLDNNLIMANQVFRGYESEFQKKVNGYEVGDTISIKRPMDFTVRDGAVASNQDVVEGKFTLSVNQQKGVDFDFTSEQLTLKIEDLSERVIKPAMIQLANDVDRSLMDLYKQVSSHVGTYGETIDSFVDFSKGPERLDEGAVPADNMRSAVLSPKDHWGVVGSQTSLLNNELVGSAYRRGSLGNIAGMDTFMAQNIPTHTVGTYSGTPVTNGIGQEVTYAVSKDTNQWTLSTNGWTATTLNEGDTITIDGVFAVNPVTKEPKAYLKQFVVRQTVNDTAGAIDVVLSPAAITTGAFKTVSVAADTIPSGAAITVSGATGVSDTQNLFFHKNAFSLVMVPMIIPPGSVDSSRETYKNTSARLIPYYDGTNDISNWRFDILYGVLTVDERLAVRVNGTA